jgi:hypothetical protein
MAYNDTDIESRARQLKLRATSILTQVSEMERKYLAGESNNRPHLIDVLVYYDKYLQFAHTLEPHTASTTDLALCGYDVNRQRYMTIKWADLLQISLNSLVYEPVPAQVWESRNRETNMLLNDANVIRQHVAVFNRRS